MLWLVYLRMGACHVILRRTMFICMLWHMNFSISIVLPCSFLKFPEISVTNFVCVSYDIVLMLSYLAKIDIHGLHQVVTCTTTFVCSYDIALMFSYFPKINIDHATLDWL